MATVPSEKTTSTLQSIFLNAFRKQHQFTAQIHVDKADVRRLPLVFSMQIADWIESLTHPTTGSFPHGLSPRQMLQLANRQVAAYYVDHGMELSPSWRDTNLNQILMNEVRAGRIVRVRHACYVGPSHRKDSNKPENVTNNLNRHSQVGIKVPITATGTYTDSLSTGLRSKKLSISSVIERQIQKRIFHHQIQVQESSTLFASSMAKKDTELKSFLCVNCNKGLDSNLSEMILKCQGCEYQSHLECNYLESSVPAFLLVPGSKAITDWRCYDCKFCRVCNRKDDVNDGLLLCDACDTGEHMGCQNPPLVDVPPAPWYCTGCANQKINEGKVPSCEPTQKLEDHASTSSSVKNENAISKNTETPNGSTSSAQESKQEPEQKSLAQSPRAYCEMQPSNESAWFAVLNPDTSPISEASSSLSPVHQTNNQNEMPPIKIKIGKRRPSERQSATDSNMEKLDSDQAPDGVKKRKTVTPVASLTSGSPKPAVEKSHSPTTPVIDSIECGRMKSKEKTESSQPSSNQLVMLNEADTAEVKKAKQWTSDQAADFMERMGHEEIARAFKREEIDGEAMLLLQRHDVLHTLNLKLGPAVKAYHFIKSIQTMFHSQ